jgi:hypothetical protein
MTGDERNKEWGIVWLGMISDNAVGLSECRPGTHRLELTANIQRKTYLLIND